jgi:hypothetical protein
MIQRTHIPLLRAAPRQKAKRRRIPRAKPERRRQRADYDAQRKDYLQAHPFCQIWIARYGLREAQVIAADGRATIHGVPCRAPRADQIHHRNKCYGARLTDERWWMGACLDQHEWVEGDKFTARATGFLLPLEADADGRSPGGQALTTPAFMAYREGFVSS